ncbi:MAG: hypothetical protein WCK00_15240, partial [Deltaproteobacteria bacterium]
MKTGLRVTARVTAFFCFVFLLLIFNAGAVVQSTWIKLTTDSRTVVKESITAEVNKQNSYSLPEQAAGNLRNVQKEKDDEDATYKADLRIVTGEFNRTKQKRDDLTTRFLGKSQELEEIQKSIQNLKKGVENYNSNIARFEEEIRSQQSSLEKWLKTEKQGEAAVSVIYTRGFKDIAHELEKFADQVSAPLLAESMGIKIRAQSQVINNVLAKDIVQATVEGTAKPMNEEPFRLELDNTPAGTVYLRLKRYELFPFQNPAAGSVKPGTEAGRFKARIVASGAELEAFLKTSGHSLSKGDLARLQQVIEDAKENNRAAENSLGSQIETYQSKIRQLKEKIEDQRAEKTKDERKLTREQESYQKLKGEATAAETAKGSAEREFLQSQSHLQGKKRVRETIIVKDARAVPKGSEAPADAVSAVIIDKLEEVRNDARTQHSTATTTVVNYQVASEQAGQAVTDAKILAVRLISFVNEGGSGVRVQIAFRVRTVLSDEAETPRQSASVPLPVGLVKTPARITTLPSAPAPPSSTAGRSITEAGEIARDGRFIAYNNGTVLDTRTNLMWA